MVMMNDDDDDHGDDREGDDHDGCGDRGDHEYHEAHAGVNDDGDDGVVPHDDGDCFCDGYDCYFFVCCSVILNQGLEGLTEFLAHAEGASEDWRCRGDDSLWMLDLPDLKLPSVCNSGTCF